MTDRISDTPEAGYRPTVEKDLRAAVTDYLTHMGLREKYDSAMQPGDGRHFDGDGCFADMEAAHKRAYASGGWTTHREGDPRYQLSPLTIRDRRLMEQAAAEARDATLREVREAVEAWPGGYYTRAAILYRLDALTSKPEDR